MSEPLSRRQFLGATVAVGGSAPAARAERRRRYWCPPQPCPCPPGGTAICPRVRQNMLSLAGAQLESLRRGVAAMQPLPASDRRSWTFQAAIHGTNDPMASDPLFNQCEHT